MMNFLYLVCLILLVWSDNFLGYNAVVMQGGQHDQDNEVIWQVSYQKKRIDGSWKHICGGSIVSDRHIITAAHCFIFIGENETEVWDGREKSRIVIGTNDLKSFRFRVKIGKVIILKAYTSLLGGELLVDDIAVIILKHRLNLSINGDKYGPIDVFDPKDEIERKKYDDQVGFVAGFGATKVKCGRDGKIKYVYDGLRRILPLQLTNHRCPKLHGLRCIRYKKRAKEPKGICCGDSGGPLYYKSGTKFELVGVISTGPDDCDLRKSCTLVATVMFIPDYKDFLDKARALNRNTTFLEMSVEEFEESAVDYLVLPDQAELARQYYV